MADQEDNSWSMAGSPPDALAPRTSLFRLSNQVVTATLMNAGVETEVTAGDLLFPYNATTRVTGPSQADSVPESLFGPTDARTMRFPR